MSRKSCKRAGEGADLPAWVSPAQRTYLAHTEAGLSLRALARGEGGHASTILRRVRRCEQSRDDPLCDAGLARLAQGHPRTPPALPIARLTTRQDQLPMTSEFPDEETLARETLRALRALSEAQTLLVIAANVEDAVVVRLMGDAAPVRRAVVARPVAESLALRGFIAGETVGRISRYQITPEGRSALIRLTAEAESHRAKARGRGEDMARENAGIFSRSVRDATPRGRSAGAESPLAVLARRQRRDGEAWLPPELLAAALRFQESYEITRLDGQITRDWNRLITGRIGGGRAIAGGGGATRRLEAEESLAAAIRALGPDLAETVILSVCEDLGMEVVEERLDFPARSGKLALRIALRRLALHYAETARAEDDLIY